MGSRVDRIAEEALASARSVIKMSQGSVRKWDNLSSEEQVDLLNECVKSIRTQERQQS